MGENSEEVLKTQEPSQDDAPEMLAARDKLAARDTFVGATYQFTPKNPGDVLMPNEPAFGLKLGAIGSSYTPKPASKQGDPEAQRNCWRIELHGLAKGIPPLGFDILGDVILGREDAEPTEQALIDLIPFKAQMLGVSRQHALLRPTHHALFLIDLNSANGTYHNGMKVQPSFVRTVTSGDMLSLGTLVFQIVIIDGPFRHGNSPPEG